MTDEQWELQDYYDDLEKQWKKSLPNYTDSAWLEIFPEAEPIIRRETRKQIADLKQKQQLIYKDTQRVKNDMSRSPATEHIFWEHKINLLKEQFDKIDRELRGKIWLLNKLNGAVQNPNAITPEDIKAATKIPFENIIGAPDKRMSGKLWYKCMFHSEKTPSFQVDSNNRWRCFGACSEGGDLLDWVQKKYVMSLPEAVRWLLNK